MHTHTRQWTLARLYTFFVLLYSSIGAHSKKVLKEDALDNLTPSPSVKDRKQDWESELRSGVHSMSRPGPLTHGTL